VVEVDVQAVTGLSCIFIDLSASEPRQIVHESSGLSVGVRRPYGANLSRKNPRFDSVPLRSDALATDEHSSSPCFTKPFVHFCRQVCCPPVPSLHQLCSIEERWSNLWFGFVW
jgi:hypothetical protein